ncbi:hypothetical protein [Geodermatophilus pulveris]|uniref:hypothetical protein n=1 Tax=Geodermatophilus pulveris TaxID=1564159 RepID=UPI00117B20C3|nr:hypothetical protein [Geodermatophilus pulveris]
MTNLLLGTLASIIAGVAMLILTNKDDIRYYLVARRRHRVLQDTWVHYRLTRSKGSAESLWVGSTVDLHLNRFGRLRGAVVPTIKSPSEAPTQSHASASEQVERATDREALRQPAPLETAIGSFNSNSDRMSKPASLESQGVELELSRYSVGGAIRNGVMRLRLENEWTQQEPITMTYPNLQSRQLLGVWLGQDMDQRWTTSPSILSRDVLTREDLDEIALRQRVLSRVTTRHFVRFFPGEVSARWWTEVGRRTVEYVDSEGRCPRCVIEGEAREDGTDKLVFGPYERLPLVGTYEVTWRLAVHCPDTVDKKAEVVRLDVYGRDRAMGEWRLKREQVTEEYRYYSVKFPYRNPRLALEYRVSLLKKGVVARLYDVTVERPGVNDD